jgi:hypothetical protein
MHPPVLLVPCALALLGCESGHACGDFETCVSSQAEADRMNAGSNCRNYVYCPPSDGGLDDSDAGSVLGDGQVGDVASDSAGE